MLTMLIYPSARLLFCLAMTLALLTQVFAQIPPPSENQFEDVGIDQRDWLGNLATTDSSIAPDQHPSLEVDLSEQANPPLPVTHVAYVKGSTVSVKIRLANNRALTVAGTMTIQGARLEVPGPSSADPGPYYLSLSASPSSFTFSLPAHTTYQKTITISGLPSSVAVGAFQIKYDLPLVEDPGGEQESTANNGTEGGFVNWERICVLNATPVGYLEDDEMAIGESPWEHGIWTDFLEYTCRWAFGATTSNDACVRMTEGIHQSKYAYRNWLYFEASNSRYWIPSPDPAQPSIFELGEFLNAIGDPNVQQQRCAPLDCRDFSGLLQLALGTQGIYSGCVAYQAQPWTKFMTWPLCPAGSDPTLTGPAYPYTPTVSGNYMSTWFSAHMVVHIGESAFDASNAYFFDYSGFPWAKTPYFWNRESLWQWGPNFFGLAYRPTTGTEQDMANNTYNFFNTLASIQIPFQYILGYKPTFIKDFLS